MEAEALLGPAWGLSLETSVAVVPTLAGDAGRLGARIASDAPPGVPQGSDVHLAFKSHSWPSATALRKGSPLRADSAPGCLRRDGTSSNTLHQLAVPQMPQQRPAASAPLQEQEEPDAFSALRAKRKRGFSEGFDEAPTGACTR